nr:glycosyl hydrolase [Bacteroidota bacterium]
HETIIHIRDLRQQLMNYKSRVPADSILSKEITSIDSAITRIEEGLYQTKNRSNQDPLNFPIRLTDKLSYVGSMLGNGEFPPTDQAVAVAAELSDQIDLFLSEYKTIKTEKIPAFNKLIRDRNIDAIILKEE